MKRTNQNLCTKSIQAGHTGVCVVSDEENMGRVAQELVRSRALSAADAGNRVVFWLMAAPSGFSWYDAFIQDCHNDPGFAEIVRSAEFFQFDDYRIGRNDSRFPVTFRHLLEDRFFSRLGAAYPGSTKVHLLDLTGENTDQDVVVRYLEQIQSYLDDPSTTVIQVKGVGMDGHWGFHGRETPLDHRPEFMEVQINRQNRIQQTIDWPQYFPDLSAVPDTAITASVSLFLQADTIVDLVPQRSKLFALLAAYGTDEIVPEITSSALKEHPDSHSFVTTAAAKALVSFRETKKLTPEIEAELDLIWQADDESRQWSRNILETLRIY